MNNVMQLGDLTKIATYEEFDRAFQNESRRVSQGFIRMGYLLRMARDTDILYNSGYKSIAEYADKKYGFKPDYVSNLIKVNEKYSEGGYSDQIQERYSSWGFSLLVELADLPEEIAEEIPEGTKREAIREVKREIRAEEQITPIEAALEEENRATRMWETTLEKFTAQYYYNNPEEFKEAWKAMRRVSAGLADISKTVMDLLAPSGICTKMARIKGVGKFMLTIKDELTPPTLANVRTVEKEAVGWEELHRVMDAFFNNPLDSGYQDTWHEMYGEAFPGEEENEKSIPDSKGSEKVQENGNQDMETVSAGGEPDEESKVEDREPAEVESDAEGRGSNEVGIVFDAEDVPENQRGPENAQNADPERILEKDLESERTPEFAPAQSVQPDEPADDPDRTGAVEPGTQATIEDYPDVLPDGYVPAEKTDEMTELWDRARALAGAIQDWMGEHSYGVGRGTKAGLKDIVNAASELQEVALELSYRL